MKTASISYTKPQLDVEYDFVAVIDGLPPVDRAAFDLSREITSMLEGEGISCRVLDSASLASARGALDRLEQDSKAGKRFALHFVGHGNANGVGVGPEFMDWKELGSRLVPVNTAMSGALIVNMTSCRGVHGIKSTQLSSSGDPFFGIVGAAQVLSVADAHKINRSFYAKWFSGTPINTIVHEINTEFGYDILFCASSEGYRSLNDTGGGHE